MMESEADARTRIRQVLPPIALILICIPLALDWIPRNRWYGIRISQAMTSDAMWYRANRLGGIALIGASVIWLAAAAYAPRQYVKPIGLAAVALTIVLLALTLR